MHCTNLHKFAFTLDEFKFECKLVIFGSRNTRLSHNTSPYRVSHNTSSYKSVTNRSAFKLSESLKLNAALTNEITIKSLWHMPWT